MNWWDNLKTDRSLTERERENYGKHLYEVVISKTATTEQRANAYREWLKVAIVPYVPWRGKE